MGQEIKTDKTIDPRERELIVAYLSYALDDVRALSAIGVNLLQMTIATIAEESITENSARSLNVAPRH
jgi:alkylhydroperoxidase/carboxymuconolactone decarboxylase family protein YurZ